MAQSTQDPRISFNCEQFDKFSTLTRRFVLRYFYDDNSIEMIERCSGKLVLKRTKTDLSRSAFYVGSRVDIRGTVTTITDYADEATRRTCEDGNARTIVIISDRAFSKLGRYISMLTEECGFVIANVQMMWISDDICTRYELDLDLLNTRVVIIQGVHATAVQRGQQFAQRAPGTFAAEDEVQGKYWAELIAHAAAEPLAVHNEINSSVIVFKPHLITCNQAGVAIQQILDAGLEPVAFSHMSMNMDRSIEFLRPYRGVLPNFGPTASSLVGDVWVMQVMRTGVAGRGPGEPSRPSPQQSSTSVVGTVRQICGPYDTAIARELCRNSLRARFGKDQAQNAVHCCDLEDDAPDYADFFFRCTCAM